MGKIYSYAEYLPIAKVGDVVRAVEGKFNDCTNKLSSDGSNTEKITEVDEYAFSIGGCSHESAKDAFLELVSPRIPTWETLAVGDEIETVAGNGQEMKVLAVLGDLFARSWAGQPNTFCSWATKQTAQHDGWSLVTPPIEPEVEEMTLEQVNKLLGKKVKIVE